MKTFVFAIAVVAAALAGVALASAWTSQQERSPHSDDPGRPVAGTERVDARVPNPRGGPPWAVRTQKNHRGDLCLTLGRVRGDEFGEFGAYTDEEDSRFVRQPHANSSCVDPSALPDDRPFEPLTRRDARLASDGQERIELFVVYGVVRNDVERLTLHDDDGEHGLALSAAGAFVSAYDRAPGALRLEARLRDGSRAEFDVPTRSAWSEKDAAEYRQRVSSRVRKASKGRRRSHP